MNLIDVAAPDLESLSVGGPTLQLLEGLDFSDDGRLLLVRATFTDVGDSTNALRQGYFLYDVVAGTYVRNLSEEWQTTGAETSAWSHAEIIGSSSGYEVVAATRSTGLTPSDQLVLFNETGVSDANWLNTLLGTDLALRLERVALSQDGRFFAVQTDSPALAPDLQPDTNDVSDIHLIDRLTHNVTRVSQAGGAGVDGYTLLGSLRVDGQQIKLGFVSTSAYVAADSNGASANEPDRVDAYLWTSALDQSGLTGSSSITLLSKGLDGEAAGKVATDQPVTVTGNQTFFVSQSSALVTGDNNDANDVFLYSTSGVIQRLSIQGSIELSNGATLLGVSSSGEFVAISTDAAPYSTADGLLQAVIVNTTTGNWKLASADSSGLPADDIVINGTIAPSGGVLAFTSNALNLTGVDGGVAAQGSLYIAKESVSSLNVQTYLWKSHGLIPAVQVTANGLTESTNTTGSTSIELPIDRTLSVQATKTLSPPEQAAADSAVNLQDAIAILKMIVGLDVNGAGKALSPYQSLAADFDGNGTVTLTDAIGVLKHVVGLASPDPTLKFVDETSSAVSNISANPLKPGTHPAIQVDTTDITALHVGAVGYLSGDVDGSYTGGATSTLPLDYFNQLHTTTGISLTQFGVYGG